jgi:hypothetical protein
MIYFALRSVFRFSGKNITLVLPVSRPQIGIYTAEIVNGTLYEYELRGDYLVRRSIIAW